MKKHLFYAVIILILGATKGLSQAGEKFTGDWEGKINARIGLRIVFHVHQNSSGIFVSTADSPDQSAYGIKCDSSFIKGDNFTIEIRAINASFTGKMLNDSTIDGKFKQGVEIPLVLHHKVESASSERKTEVPLNYKSVDVAVEQKGATLSGICFQPLNDTKSLAILIIAGSGPTDRDGNSPLLPGKNNSLLQLADSLTQYGIASLRYDKRGIGKSKVPPGTGEMDMTIEDMAADAAAMYDWLVTHGYKNIFIAGHSEGSLIGLMIAAKVTASGFISIAGAGRKAGDILKEQVAVQMTPALVTEFNTAIDSLGEGFTVKKINPSLASLLRPSVQPYIRSWLQQDPQKLISQLKCPVLILQGTNDLQVKEKDAKALKTAQPKAELVMVKDMNHVLKEVKSSQVNDNIKAYSDPSLPVAQLLIHSVMHFLFRTIAE